LGEQPCGAAVTIPGNHDQIFEREPAFARGFLTNAIYVGNSGREIVGLKSWGSPVQPWFMDCAFNVPRGEATKRYWDMIPEGLDI
jgi:hypothetical protein